MQELVRSDFQHGLDTVFDRLEPNMWDSVRSSLAQIVERMQRDTEHKSHGVSIVL